MKELLRTNEPVLLSWMQALLRAERIETVVLDGHASAAQGGTYAIPRRLMVEDPDYHLARRLIEEAGEGDRLRPE